VSNSGIIDWDRLDRSLPWIKYRTGYSTSVFAFWLADYGRSRRDHGVTLLKAQDRHPDWFLHAETADHVLAAYPPPKSSISPNYSQVFGVGLQAKPLLASMLLGTADAYYQMRDRMWWADHHDLTRRGRRLITNLDHLYERCSVLVTFVEGKSPSDETSGPRGPVPVD
jgi:hypothetical protein